MKTPWAFVGLICVMMVALPVVAAGPTDGRQSYKIIQLSDGADVRLVKASDATGGAYSSIVTFQPAWDPAKLINVPNPDAQVLKPYTIPAPPNAACGAWLKDAYEGPLKRDGFLVEP